MPWSGQDVKLFLFFFLTLDLPFQVQSYKLAVAVISQTLAVLKHKMTELNPDLCERQVIKDYFLNKGTCKTTHISIFTVKNEKQVYMFLFLGS